jgi:hypothetical protein
MLVLFAVFLVSVLVAFVSADGGAARIARLNVFASRAGDMAKALADYGTEIVERSAAGMAANPRSSVGIDRLLRRSARRPAVEAQDASEP